ncbi:hypothetical protein HQQ80_09175 [Microbacteriaceae bacterium VKM Ac-2855]|nr:hypothetical protein [Microbacteriaceae bacterium VKM Ac-2855]
MNRKKLPADALQFAIIALNRHRYETNNATTSITRAMLGLDGYDGYGQSAVAD